MAGLIDRCQFVPSGPGTGDFVVVKAVTGYQTPSQANAVDGEQYYYGSETSDRTQWEVGLGTWHAASNTLARTQILFSSNNNLIVNYSTVPNVFPTFVAENKATASDFGIVKPDNSSITVTNGVISATGAGLGTVTSVGLSMPNIFTVTGSPVTSSGTLTATLATETANFVFAGPTSGAAAAPTFRALVANDIPALTYAPQTSGTSILYGNGSGGFSNATVGTGLSFVGGTLTATAVGANPTATAGPNAINGSAATFMRSDGAPAIQLGTNAQKGIVQVDGTSITASSGVISATVTGFANPTGTAGPSAVNGVATTAMRSDGAPAIKANLLLADVVAVIDGGGSAIAGGKLLYLTVDFNCTIQQVTLLADQSGSLTCNIWKCTYAQFDAGSTHPVTGDSITASATPALSSATKYQDSTLTGWTTTINAGDVLAFQIPSNATSITRLSCILKVTKT